MLAQVCRNFAAGAARLPRAASGPWTSGGQAVPTHQGESEGCSGRSSPIRCRPRETGTRDERAGESHSQQCRSHGRSGMAAQDSAIGIHVLVLVVLKGGMLLFSHVLYCPLLGPLCVPACYCGKSRTWERVDNSNDIEISTRALGARSRERQGRPFSGAGKQTLQEVCA